MKRILIAAVASSLATGAVIAATGIAQDDNDDKTKPPPTMKQALADAEKQRDAHLARIAKRLDVSTEKLKDSIEKVRDAELDAAVDAGRLTDAQRDAIKACKDNPLTCDRSNLPAFRHEIKRALRRGDPPRGELRREFGNRRSDFFEALAKELGKDADDVQRAFLAERPRFRRGERGFHRPGGPPPGGPGGPGPGGPGFFGGP
jgi:hypothetical protein